MSREVRSNGSPVNRWRIGGKDVEVDVRGHLVLDDEAFLLDAALDGVGLVYLTHTAAAPHLAAKRLTRVLERYSPRFDPLQLVYPARRQLRPALRAFIDLVKERRSSSR